MSFVSRCRCGKKLRVPDAVSCKRVHCPDCGAVHAVADLTPVVEEDERASADRARSAAQPARLAGAWNRRYAVLALALLPLVLSTFRHDESPAVRLEETLEAAPEDVGRRVAKLLDSPRATLADVLEALPGGKLDGALLAKSSWGHWGLAALAALGASLGIAVVFGLDRDRLRTLALVATFTGTIGIAFLLTVQSVASWTHGTWIRGGGLFAIVFYVVKLIGFSYRAALDPSNGFGASFFGFTCGVGFCEELCKAVPLVSHYRTEAKLDWRGACLWGLASGIGFGISEGITYSSAFYNGIAPGQIYVVRFVSCVALHAFWAAAIGIAVHERQTSIQGEMTWLELLLALLPILAIPMLLHGLYDTLLKRDHDGLALVVAAVSFGWLAALIERQLAREIRP